MARLAPLLLVAVLLVLAGCFHGDGEAEDAPPPPPAAEQPEAAVPEEDPGEFVQSLVEQLFGGQHDAVWERLHPSQRETVAAEAFERCLEAAVQANELQSVQVDEVVEEEVTLAGESCRAAPSSRR